MRTIPWIRFFLVWLVGAVALFCGQACAPQRSDTESDTAVNLAVMAEPSSSIIVGNEALAALNDGFDPENSQDRSHGAFSIWRMDGTQWVQYDWSRPISTDKIDVYWRADQRRVNPPQACRVLYWDGE
ncbi:MAG: Tat pathway signal protein, partial [Candidatus Aminicenantes bacterium]|nr:Tat pathway signal protein [Candidatus Aminicenantes bacterium]